MSPESRRDHSGEGLRKKSVTKKRAHQQCHRHAQRRAKIDKLLPLLADRAHERLAIGSQHVNSRDHDAPEGKHGGDLKSMKAIDRPAALERAKKDHDFPGKIREAGKTDRSECAESK